MIRSALLFLAGLVLAVAAVTALAFRSDMTEAERTVAGPSRTFESPFGTIEYADEGRGQPVLMVHGSGGGFDQGVTFARPLIDAGFRVIAPSRFGYLRSAMPSDATPQLQADAFAALLEELGVRQAIIIGGSAGALSAAQLAIRHPQLCGALVLVVPASYAPDRVPGTNAEPRWWPLVEAALGSDVLFWAAIRLMPDMATRMILATDPTLVHAASQQEQKRVAEMLRSILPVSRRRAGLLMDMATAGAPPPYPFRSIPCPVLTVSAEDDLYGTAASARHAAATAPNGKAIVYPTGGHMLVGRQEEAWSAILGFIAASGTANAVKPSAPPRPRQELESP